ncbi:MAG: glycosyltransferase family 9 protein [Desulfurivibrionaceae bacterium]
MRKHFKKAPYDLVLDLHASFRSALIGRTNPNGYRVGFGDGREGNPLVQNHLIQVKEQQIHALDKNLLFCDYLECPARKADFYLPFNKEDKLAAGNFLERVDSASQKNVIYFNPAARWETKYWYPEKWALLGDRLTREHNSLIVLAGSKADREYLFKISSLMKEKAAVTAGELSLPAIAALMDRIAAYVGLDSGPMHMAAMAGVPVAALFGPTNPELVRPYGVRHRIIRNHDIDCLGCRKRYCESLACMKGISVDQVYEEVLELS